ncbi:MAG: MFS transporter [Candidatus Nanopelagicales bacterium]
MCKIPKQSLVLPLIQKRIPLLRDLPVEITALALIAFSVSLGFGIVVPVIPTFAREFGVSAIAATSVVSVFAGMRLLASPVAAKLVDRIGERRVLTWGLAIVSISSFLSAFSQNFVQLIIARGIGGVGSTMYTLASMALLLKVVDINERGRASSAWTGGFLIGGLTGPALGGFVAAISIRAPFFVYGLTLIVAGFISWKTLQHATLQSKQIEETEPNRTLPMALRMREYRATVAVNFSNGFIRFGMLTALTPLFAIEALNSSTTIASWGFLASAVGQVIFLSWSGREVDSSGRKPILLGSSALTVAGLLLLSFTETIPVFLVAMFIVGVSGALASASSPAILGDVTGGAPRGPVVAAYQMSSDLGAIIGPIFGGLMLDISNGFHTPFLAVAAMAFIVFFMVLRIPETLNKVAL